MDAKCVEQVDSALAGPLVHLQPNLAQMRGREIFYSIGRIFISGHLNHIFLVEFSLHNIGGLIETVAALLVASVSKIISGHGADVRMCYF